MFCGGKVRPGIYNSKGSLNLALALLFTFMAVTIFVAQWPFIRKQLVRASMDPASRGLLDMRQGHFGLAQKSFESLLAREPGSGKAYYLLGWSLQAQGRDEAALGALGRAERLAQGDRHLLSQIYAQRGGVFSHRGEQAAAITEYQRAIALSPQSVDERFKLGMAYLALSKRAEALAQFEVVLRLDSRHRGAAYQLQSLRPRLAASRL